MTDTPDQPDGGLPPGDLDQIRRILFGADVARLDGRAADLDAKLRDGLAALTKETHERLADLEAFVMKEVAGLRAEFRERTAALGADKMDRSDLAALLAEAAGRLDGNGAAREPRRG